MAISNIWQCSDYGYTSHPQATHLPRIHPSRADKLKMFGLAGGMTFLCEHVLRNQEGVICYLAYEWVDWRGKHHAYITFELIPNDAIECGYYMRIAGLSSDSWLLERLLYDADGQAIGMHNPSERAGALLWTASRTLEGIL